MSAGPLCPCGGPFVAHGPERFCCATCGRPASAPPRRFWALPLLAGGATLLLMVGLGLGLAQLLPSRSNKPPAPPAPPEAVAVVPERPASPAPPAPAPDPGVKPDEGRAPDKPMPPPVTVEAPRKPPTPRPVEPQPKPAVTVPAPKPKPKPKEPPPKPATVDLQAGDKFYQEVLVSRVSSYNSLAGNFTQNTRYALLSRFEVVQKKADGGLVVKQKVEGVRLSNTDRALQGQLNALLQKTRGATFTYELNAQRQVVRFKGQREGLQVFAGNNPLGGQTFLLWSFLDPDGWKELAQLSFFRPPQPIKKGQVWASPMTHSWGPLGSWHGRAVYAHAGKKGGLDHYQYALQLVHRPPAGAGGLPIQIGKTDFRIQTAGGMIAYDGAKGRVAAFEERFHVRGLVGVSALGVNTAISMDEAQVFQVRLLDRNPWKE